MEMEKPMAVLKYRYKIPFWFVLLCPFLLCFISFQLYFSTVNNFRVTFLVHNFEFPNPENEKPNYHFLRNFLGNQATPNDATNNNYRVDSCSGRYIYIHNLPSKFNEDLVKKCHTLEKWNDMCDYLSNNGFGVKLEDDNSKRVLMENGWYLTHQYSSDVIFHYRMKNYKCLTNDSSIASAIFVPFYAGLEVGQHLWASNMSERDSLGRELVNWLARKPEWKTMWGRDHFLIGGRVAWDLRRKTDDETDWGSKLMFMPESRNMTLLTMESSLWNNDIAVPFPTHFHPREESQVFVWQERMRKIERNYLFSFAGAPRPKSEVSIRSELIRQCESSPELCEFMPCGGSNRCDEPANVIRLYQNSIFCLEPVGDSCTRRSTFDSILAGCIPVFFHPGTAYSQYVWHLVPKKNHSEYSVFIPENDIKEKRAVVSERLLGISKDEAMAMREEVIKLIPKVIYGDWRPGVERTFDDAFDIAVNGLLQRVKKVRKKMKEGDQDLSEYYAEEHGWKF